MLVVSVNFNIISNFFIVIVIDINLTFHKMYICWFVRSSRLLVQKQLQRHTDNIITRHSVFYVRKLCYIESYLVPNLCLMSLICY